MQDIKKDTAGNDAFGPLLYPGNGTLYTANDVTYNDVYIWKNGGAEAAGNDVSFVPVGTTGIYTFAWGAATPSDLGRLTLTLNKSGLVAAPRVFMVVTANYLDSKCGNDTFDVNVTGMANDVITPEAIANDAIHADALSTGALNDIQGAANAALVALDLDHLVNNATGVPALPSGVLLDLLNDLINLRAGTEAQTSFGQIINMMQGNDTFLDNGGTSDNSIAHFLRALASTAATLPTGLSNGTTFTNATMSQQSIAAKTGSLTFTGNDVHSKTTAMANDVLTDAAVANDTYAGIKAAMEASGGHLALILEDTGTTIPNTLTTISGYVDCLPATWVTVPTTTEIVTAMETNGSKLDHLWEMTEDDAGVRRFTENALELAPASGGGTTVNVTTEGTNIITD